ncbi:MAG: hypothetical protein QOJ99_5329 [Bryobacterales bacterium]|jgi:enterochelin esterase family protein|nr:hypothetical protein [Bryobacterales bacterium]
MILKAGLLLITASLSWSADKLLPKELIDLALKSPGQAQLREALIATAPPADLKAGTAAFSDRGRVVFAVESASAPELFIDDQPGPAMSRFSGSQLWFAQAPLAPGSGHAFFYKIDGKRFGGNNNVPSFGPDSYLKPGVPKGTLSQKSVLTSRIYDGMQSDYWVYTPAQYDPKTPAALMVWNDGQQYINRDSASIKFLDVVDNLTYQKKLPVTVYVFTMPGVTTMPEGTPFYRAVQRVAKADTDAARTAALRGVEYETLSDQYARFCAMNCCPRWRRNTTSAKTPTATPSRACRAARWELLPPHGSSRICSAACWSG